MANTVMTSTAQLAETAALIGDPARANMLIALLDGRALTASELARAAGITPQTTSSHLAHLTDAGLLTMTRQGRHHYHRLASAEVARMLENIMSVTASRRALPVRPVRTATGPRDAALRRARTCYDHLAGQLAVAVADRMIERGQIDLSPDGGALSEEGAAFLLGLGVDLEAARVYASRRGGRRIYCRACLDWSERRPHIAGAVGTAMARAWFARGWLRRIEGSRAVALTRIGEAALGKAFALEHVQVG
ncbi:MAG: ArsR/SmtB family transcription factor [Acetobacteraceae bacterium]